MYSTPCNVKILHYFRKTVFAHCGYDENVLSIGTCKTSTKPMFCFFCSLSYPPSLLTHSQTIINLRRPVHPPRQVAAVSSSPSC